LRHAAISEEDKEGTDMADTRSVASHYTHGNLLDSIIAGVSKLGKTRDSVSVEDLGAVDEFHIGGRGATEAFLSQLSIEADDHVLDVGCGLGGASRFAAQQYGCRVTGIDVTPEYVETGTTLCVWVGLDGRVRLEHGDGTALRYADDAFDKAYMLHVGMNVSDKRALVAELRRVLKPGGTLGVYDVMRVGKGRLTYPLPWAMTEAEDFVESPGEYKDVLEKEGFKASAERNRRDFALEFFARLQAIVAAPEGPPPLGPHILLGETAPTKVRNIVQAITESRLAPVELIAERVA
jgi:ubiquinone/menaquinone biosynthesis C-methylase UbiE